jgi:type IV pilus assembly protein PilF
VTSARLVAAVVLALGLAGCATQPAGDNGPKSGEASTTVNESSERSRARIHTQLAAGYYEIGNMGIALEEVKEAQKSDPGFGPAYNLAGLVYSRLKEDGLAEQSFQRALAIDPNDSDAQNNYGLFLCERGRLEPAVKYFLSAVRNPLYANPERAYVNAGVCTRRTGNVAVAEEYFQTALKMRPTQPQALYQLADLAYARGDLGVAKGYLGRLAQSGVTTAEVLWLGARVERKLGDRNAEASYASQLRNRYPNSAEARALGAGQYE